MLEAEYRVNTDLSNLIYWCDFRFFWWFIHCGTQTMWLGRIPRLSVWVENPAEYNRKRVIKRDRWGNLLSDGLRPGLSCLKFMWCSTRNWRIQVLVTYPVTLVITIDQCTSYYLTPGHLRRKSIGQIAIDNYVYHKKKSVVVHEPPVPNLPVSFPKANDHHVAIH